MMPSAALEESDAALALVGRALGSGVLTARGADRVRRVARTIADLDGEGRVDEMHMAEAIGLRGEWRDA
jgi:magnesium chelatase family protein